MLLLGYLHLLYISNIMATNKNEKMDAIIVTLNTYLKAILSRLIFNYGEFAIIKNRIVYLLPNSNIFQCISIT